MTYYWDLNRNRLVQGVGSEFPALSFAYKYNDIRSDRLVFCASTGIVDPGDVAVSFGIKEADGPEILLTVGPTEISKTGSGATAVWTIPSSFSSLALATRLKIGTNSELNEIRASMAISYKLGSTLLECDTVEAVIFRRINTLTAP